MAGINMPHRRPDPERAQPEESTLEKVMKGMQLLSAGVGVYKGIKDVNAQSRALELKEEEAKRIQEGYLTPKEQLEYSDKYNASDTQTPGSFGLKSPDGKDVYYSPKAQASKQAASPLEFSKLLGDGFKQAKPGTPGSILLPVAQADGSVKEFSLMPPPRKIDPNAPVTDPNKKLAGLPTEARMKVGLINTALENMTNYEKAYAEGQVPKYLDANTPLIGGVIGDTDLTKSQRLLNEAVGRLHSGGVIGDDELKNFRAMGPRPADTPEMRAKKIGDQRDLLENKLIALGFRPEELGQAGFDSAKAGYDDSSRRQRGQLQHLNAANEKKGYFDKVDTVKSAQASGAEGEADVPKEFQEALVFASDPKNAKHPALPGIISRLRNKGLWKE